MEELNKCQNHQKYFEYYCEKCGEILCSKCKKNKMHFCPKPPQKIELLPDDLAHHFHFIKFLGRGSSGRVFQVKNSLDDQIYALKIMEDVGEISLESNRNEITMITQIIDPNIIKYYASDCIKTENLIWITMELAQNNLGACIYNIDEKTSLQYLIEISQGLKSLQIDYGIIHKNIKLANILIVGNHAKIADFYQTKLLKTKDEEGINFTNLDRFETFDS